MNSIHTLTIGVLKVGGGHVVLKCSCIAILYCECTFCFKFCAATTLTWIVYAVMQSCVQLEYRTICLDVHVFQYLHCCVFAYLWYLYCICVTMLELVLYFQWTIEIGGQSAICSRDLGESWTQWWRERNLSKWKSWKCLRFEIPSRFSVRRQYWMFSDSVSAKV